MMNKAVITKKEKTNTIFTFEHTCCAFLFRGAANQDSSKAMTVILFQCHSGHSHTAKSHLQQ
jgi:hypothetical protein